MRFFIHIITDMERIVDHDGANFPDFQSAREEACQSARDVMAEELRNGHPIPFGWRVQLTDITDTVVQTIPFAELVFGDAAAVRIAPVTKPISPEMHIALIERAKVTFNRARASHNEIRQSLDDLRSNIRTLAKAANTIGKA